MEVQEGIIEWDRDWNRVSVVEFMVQTDLVVGELSTRRAHHAPIQIARERVF